MLPNRRRSALGREQRGHERQHRAGADGGPEADEHDAGHDRRGHPEGDRRDAGRDGEVDQEGAKAAAEQTTDTDGEQPERAEPREEDDLGEEPGDGNEDDGQKGTAEATTEGEQAHGGEDEQHEKCFEDETQNHDLISFCDVIFDVMHNQSTP